MFFDIFKCRFKSLLREKSGFFWTLAFPLILSTLFFLAFSNLNKIDKFEKIKIAVADIQKAGDGFNAALRNSGLFEVSQMDLEQAKKLLSEGDINGYIKCKSANDFELFVQKSDFEESIIKMFLDSYRSSYSSAEKIIASNPASAKDVINLLSEEKTYINEMPSGNGNSTVIYFYSLIAMVCMLSSTYGCSEVIKIQADQSTCAARINVSPSHKLKVFMASISAAFIFEFFVTLIVTAYIKFVLRIDFGTSMAFILLLCAAGCFAGISLGAMIGALVKKPEQVKIGALVSVTMFFSFLSGLMYENMKYIIQKNAPALAFINPVSLVCDGFYSLYYYDTFDRYFLNVSILAAMGILFSAVTYFVLRRQKYASI
ncbi:MAG TPA: ABC transporter permease [Oscillospiraceae bacterium]|nr:ABC transporter permease [Oscillospiraceae bacterium]